MHYILSRKSTASGEERLSFILTVIMVIGLLKGVQHELDQGGEVGGGGQRALSADIKL